MLSLYRTLRVENIDVIVLIWLIRMRVICHSILCMLYKIAWFHGLTLTASLNYSMLQDLLKIWVVNSLYVILT
jgi:hypothetical protein